MHFGGLEWRFSNSELADVLRMVASRLCSTGAGQVCLNEGAERMAKHAKSLTNLQV